MTLILDQTHPLEPRITGIRCDRCAAEIRDAIDLGEVLHIRLRAGYGSSWGDGNNVEADLCDACCHELLSPFAAVTPSSEFLAGKFATGFDSLRASPQPLVQAVKQSASAGETPKKTDLVRRIATWLIFQTRLYFVPAQVLLAPIWNAFRSFARAVEFEALKLRIKYGKE